VSSDVRILVVEDDLLVSKYIRRGLERLGYSSIALSKSAAEAEARIADFKPDIIVLDVALERKYSGINLARIADKKYQIPIVFLTGAADSRTIDLMEKSNNYGVIFKPFKINTLRVVLRMALEKSGMEKRIINDSKSLQDRLRAINAFLNVSKLMEETSDIDGIFLRALEIIPQAFKYGDKINLRITYKGKKYVPEGFKETKWVLTESFSKKPDGMENLVELYLDIPDKTSTFPFTLSEIETFSSVVKQLSVIVEKYEGDYAVKQQLANRKFSGRMMELIIGNTSLTVEEFTGYFIRGMYESLMIKNAVFLSLTGKNGAVRKYSLRRSGISFSREDVSEIISYEKENTPDVFCISEKEGVLCRSIEKAGAGDYIAVPSRIGTSLAGIFILDFKDFLQIDVSSDYAILGKIYALGLRKINREKKITVYKQAIEQNPAAVVITDLDASIVFVNSAFTRVTGYEYHEAIGRNPRILKSGSQNEDFYKDLWDTVTSGRIWRGTFHNRKKNGELFWESASISPIKNDDGVITGYIAVKEDITEKVETENRIIALNEKLKKTQSSLVMEEKLASIGRLAAGVAHELNNPIGFVYSNFRTIGRYFEKYLSFINDLKAGDNIPAGYLDELIDKNMLDVINEDMASLINESREGFERVINIINSLRSFSRIDQLKDRVRYNLNEALTTTLTVAKNQIKYIADIVKDYGDIPDIYCNSSEINQVLLNIIVNAAQAIEAEGSGSEKGVITISTYSEDEWVCCRISDTGPGIPEEILPNIFEPFFTTKPVGKGTGLGLNISYDIIVNKHSGKLTAGNNKDGGAFFLIKLPRVTEDENNED